MPRGRVVLLGAVVGALLRWALYCSRLHKFFYDRPEIATPANSFKRVLEGVALWEAGYSPYAGGACHEVPGLLLLLSFLRSLPGPCLTLVYIGLDLWTAFCLGLAGEAFLVQAAEQRRRNLAKGWKDESPVFPGRARTLITFACLFNPFSVLSCVTLTSSVLHNALLATALAATMQRRVLVTALCLALAAHQLPYSSLLLLPSALFLASSPKREEKEGSSFDSRSFFGLCGVFALLWAGAGLGTWAWMGSWEWAEAVYGFQLRVGELTPNVGLFWYFFTEMFEHFRLFFLCVFQLNLLVYVVPLALLLRQSPVMLWQQYLMLIGIFKPYPSVGDAVLHLCFLPAWAHLHRSLRHSLMVGATLAVTVVLGPVMWFLWLHAGSANANFYFAVTLAYSTAQIFLATDLLYAHLKHEVLARFGLNPTIAGKPAKFYLQK